METENIVQPTLSQEKTWKVIRWGIITFCIVHFLFEVIFGSKVPIFPVLINYFVSAWYIQRQLKRGKEYKFRFLAGVLVSAAVFLLRAILGLIFLYAISS